MADQLKNEANECFKSKCEEKKCKKSWFWFCKEIVFTLSHACKCVCVCTALTLYHSRPQYLGKLPHKPWTVFTLLCFHSFFLPYHCINNPATINRKRIFKGDWTVYQSDRSRNRSKEVGCPLCEPVIFALEAREFRLCPHRCPGGDQKWLHLPKRYVCSMSHGNINILSHTNF